MFLAFATLRFSEHHNFIICVCDIYMFSVVYSFPLNFSLFLKLITLQNTLVFSNGVLNNLFHGMPSSKCFKFAKLYLLSFYSPQAERAILG